MTQKKQEDTITIDNQLFASYYENFSDETRTDIESQLMNGIEEGGDFNNMYGPSGGEYKGYEPLGNSKGAESLDNKWSIARTVFLAFTVVFAVLTVLDIIRLNNIQLNRSYYDDTNLVFTIVFAISFVIGFITSLMYYRKHTDGCKKVSYVTVDY